VNELSQRLRKLEKTTPKTVRVELKKFERGEHCFFLSFLLPFLAYSLPPSRLLAPRHWESAFCASQTTSFAELMRRSFVDFADILVMLDNQGERLHEASAGELLTSVDCTFHPAWSLAPPFCLIWPRSCVVVLSIRTARVHFRCLSCDSVNTTQPGA
jgi:hypothetical protein